MEILKNCFQKCSHLPQGMKLQNKTICSKLSFCISILQLELEISMYLLELYAKHVIKVNKTTV